MKPFAFIISLIFLLHAPIEAQESPINLIYPRQGNLLSTTDSTLVLGRIKIPFLRFFINEQRIPVSEDGAFAGFVGIDPKTVKPDSTFSLFCRVETQDTMFIMERLVRIPIPRMPLDSTKAAIDLHFLFPSDSIWLSSGEKVGLKCRATPGAKVYFSIINFDGATSDAYLPMAETEPDLTDNIGESVFGIGKKTKRQPSPGIYTADYFLKPGLSHAKIRFFVVKNADTVYAESAARFTACEKRDLGVAELTGEINNATVQPGRSYYYFLPAGVRCAVDGRIGSQIRLRLSANHTAWLPEKNIKYLPRGAKVPASFVPLVRIKKDDAQSVIKLILSEKIPFKVEQTDERNLKLSLFGGISDTDWIRFENENSEVSNVTWSQPEADLYQLNVELAKPHYWGYETNYDGTNLIWTIRHKPKKGLKGLKICVDPGHSKDIGAVGPRGVTERQVNVEVAQALKKELESSGAVVVMTHNDTSENVSLYERVEIANRNRCDLFVSIHHNAPPDGVNPFSQAFGPSVIYYHPQSRKLAELIQKEMVSRTGLPDFGIFQGNIAVCRNAEMPAVLIECAFLSLPDHEKMIVDPKFQRKATKAIKEGIRKFLK